MELYAPPLQMANTTRNLGKDPAELNDSMIADARVIQLGVIGTGLAMERLHWPALKAMPGRYAVVAFADVSRPNAEHFASYSGVGMDRYAADYRAVLDRDDVEAVLIALPIPLLYPAVKEALAAGKHVLCEKPTGVDEAQGRDFVALAHAFPALTVLVGENAFYRDDVRLARSLLEAGAIGQAHVMVFRAVEQHIPRPGAYSGTLWRRQAQYRGGPHLDAGVHHVAQMRMLCGDALSVQGMARRANNMIHGPSDLAVHLVFAQGALGSYVSSYPESALPPGSPAVDMRIDGTDGTMLLERGPSGRRIVVYRPDGTVETHHVTDPYEGIYGELLNFSDAIIFGEPVVGTIEQSFRNMQIVLRSLDAAERDTTLPVGGAPAGSPAGVPLWRPRGAAGLFDGLPGHEVVERGSSRAAASQ